MTTVTLQEAQAKLPELVHNLTPDHELVITENDQPVAKLVAPPAAKPCPLLGRAGPARDDSEVRDAPQSRFRELAEQWRRDTMYLSNPRKIQLHWAYQQIIGMGDSAVGLILSEMKRRPGQWFWALQAITGVDPVPGSAKGKLHEMTEAWLRWGTLKGYQDDAVA